MNTTIGTKQCYKGTLYSILLVRMYNSDTIDFI